jgi:hypothetical protein
VRPAARRCACVHVGLHCRLAASSCSPCGLWLELNLRTRTVRVGDKVIDLSAREFAPCGCAGTESEAPAASSHPGCGRVQAPRR